jgi:hypothetical protein
MPEGSAKSVVVQLGLRVGPVVREILRYAWKTATLRMTKSWEGQTAPPPQKHQNQGRNNFNRKFEIAVIRLYLALKSTKEAVLPV